MPAFDNKAFSTNAFFTGSFDLIPAQPILPIPISSFRTIDAKTLADHFNRGLPRTPDYDFANRRKFYQSDND